LALGGEQQKQTNSVFVVPLFGDKIFKKCYKFRRSAFRYKLGGNKLRASLIMFGALNSSLAVNGKGEILEQLTEKQAQNTNLHLGMREEIENYNIWSTFIIKALLTVAFALRTQKHCELRRH